MTDAEIKTLKDISVKLATACAALESFKENMDQEDDSEFLDQIQSAIEQIDAAKDILNDVAEQPTESDD